jgi:cystathionine beta-lyase/cystathionine gamma-synthase
VDPARDAFDTRAVHAGAELDELTGAVSPPIYQTATYGQDGVGRGCRKVSERRAQAAGDRDLEPAAELVQVALELASGDLVGVDQEQPHPAGGCIRDCFADAADRHDRVAPR